MVSTVVGMADLPFGFSAGDDPDRDKRNKDNSGSGPGSGADPFGLGMPGAGGEFDMSQLGQIFSKLGGDLKIKPVKVGFAAYYESIGRVDLTENHQGEKPVSISGKDVRAALVAGKPVDPRIMRETTSQILAAAMAGK